MTNQEFPPRGFQFSESDTYTFLEQLGKGGHGNVFKIKNRSGRYYACKVFNPDILDDESQYRKFLQETQIGINIYHEHLVSVHKSVLLRESADPKATRYPAILMDYVKGFDLATFKKIYEFNTEKPFPRNYASLILAKACSGLEVLHKLNIQHGDIKPGNVLISQTGYPKLTDYGIATFIGDTSITGELSGTLRYLAPEQIVRVKDGGATVDQRADIYAIGIVALELTAGLPGTMYSNPGRVLDFIVNHNDDLLAHVDQTELAHDLKFVIRSCLSHRVDRRPKTVRELQNVLLHTIYGSHKGLTLEDVGDEMKRLLS